MTRSPATDATVTPASGARWRNALLILGGAAVAAALPYIFTGLAARNLLVLTPSGDH